MWQKNFFLWPEISSFDKFFALKRNSFLCQEYFSSYNKFLPLTKNFFLWGKISGTDKKFLPVTISFFLWQKISISDKKFLPLTREGGRIIVTITSYCKAQLQLKTPNYLSWLYSQICTEIDSFTTLLITLISFHFILYQPSFQIHWHQPSLINNQQVKRMRMSLSLSLTQLSSSWFKSFKCTWGEWVEQILTYSIFLVPFWIVCALYLLNHS